MLMEPISMCASVVSGIIWLILLTLCKMLYYVHKPRVQPNGLVTFLYGVLIVLCCFMQIIMVCFILKEVIVF